MIPIVWTTRTARTGAIQHERERVCDLCGAALRAIVTIEGFASSTALYGIGGASDQRLHEQAVANSARFADQCFWNADCPNCEKLSLWAPARSVTALRARRRAQNRVALAAFLGGGLLLSALFAILGRAYWLTPIGLGAAAWGGLYLFFLQLPQTPPRPTNVYYVDYSTNASRVPEKEPPDHRFVMVVAALSIGGIGVLAAFAGLLYAS